MSDRFDGNLNCLHFSVKDGLISWISFALLIVYDMCIAGDKNMIISNIELIEKIKK